MYACLSHCTCSRSSSNVGTVGEMLEAWAESMLPGCSREAAPWHCPPLGASRLWRGVEAEFLLVDAAALPRVHGRRRGEAPPGPGKANKSIKVGVQAAAPLVAGRDQERSPGSPTLLLPTVTGRDWESSPGKAAAAPPPEAMRCEAGRDERWLLPSVPPRALLGKWQEAPGEDTLLLEKDSAPLRSRESCWSNEGQKTQCDRGVRLGLPGAFPPEVARLELAHGSIKLDVAEIGIPEFASTKEPVLA